MAVTVYNFPQVGIRINANGVTVRQSHIGISAGGTGARPNAVGIHVLGDDNLIGHAPMLEAVAPWPNVISGNSGDGVVLTGANNTVAGNRIGVRKDGSSAVANGGHGIRVEGSQASIGNWSISGFLTLTARNQISGNSQAQVYLADSSGGASISCNRIGTNANANGDDLGVNQVLVSVVQGNGNLIISNTIGNGVIGLSLGVHSATTGVRGNRIGTDNENRAHPLLAGIISAGAGNTFGGTQPGNTNVLGYIQGTAIDSGPMGVFPNGGSAGLILRGNPAGSQIGLSTTANSNYIGGNLGAGIEVREGVSDVQIGVNQIGLFGSAATPNQGPAIHLLAGASNISIVSPPVGPHRLHVANSSGPAIVLDPDAGTGNRNQRVEGIDNNGKLIDLGPGGRDQDPGDADTGPNNLQNFPEFGSSTSYDEDAQELTLTFRVDSDPANAAYPLAIDVYRVYQSGTRHGWFGSVQYPAASAGEFITVTLPNPGTWGHLDGPVFAATVTDASGNTSEVSDPFDTAPPSTDEIFRDRFKPALEPAFSFSTQMTPTFQHPRCMTCHAVEATNFQRVNDDPPGVLPASHPVVDASTNCTTCHSSSLLPPTGTIDPGWQSAPAAMDFRGLDEATLCSMASQPVSGHSPLEHMTEDRLVLWAVGDGRVPFGNPVLPTAPPHDIEDWRALVNAWVDAGMPCD